MRAGMREIYDPSGASQPRSWVQAQLTFHFWDEPVLSCCSCFWDNIPHFFSQKHQFGHLGGVAVLGGTGCVEREEGEFLIALMCNNLSFKNSVLI